MPIDSFVKWYLHLYMNQAIIQEALVSIRESTQVQKLELASDSVANIIMSLETDLSKNLFLTSLIGTARGSFFTSKEADKFISRERDDWCY